MIDGLEYYPGHNFTIFNRWGNVIYKSGSDGYLNDWDGTNTEGLTIGGTELPVGTYFYIFEPGRQDENGADVKPTKGYIYLNR